MNFNSIFELLIGGDEAFVIKEADHYLFSFYNDTNIGIFGPHLQYNCVEIKCDLEGNIISSRLMHKISQAGYTEYLDSEEYFEEKRKDCTYGEEDCRVYKEILPIYETLITELDRGDVLQFKLITKVKRDTDISKVSILLNGCTIVDEEVVE